MPCGHLFDGFLEMLEIVIPAKSCSTSCFHSVCLARCDFSKVLMRFVSKLPNLPQTNQFVHLLEALIVLPNNEKKLPEKVNDQMFLARKLCVSQPAKNSKHCSLHGSSDRVELCCRNNFENHSTKSFVRIRLSQMWGHRWLAGARLLTDSPLTNFLEALA